jgi:transposase-like protein
MKKQRKHYTPEKKVAILRRRLLEQAPISQLCDKQGLQPTVFYRWQKEFFENGAAAFQPKARPNHSAEFGAIVKEDECRRGVTSCHGWIIRCRTTILADDGPFGPLLAGSHDHPRFFLVDKGGRRCKTSSTWEVGFRTYYRHFLRGT